MENDMRGMNGTAVPYDQRRYEQIWERVSPSLPPYPVEGYAPGRGMVGPSASTGMAGPGTAGPSPSGGMTAAILPASDENGALSEPGAQADPCCMGTAAAEILEVLVGFIEEELADSRHYTAFARQAPSAARQTLRQLAAEEAHHARQLMAAYYLITGRCYQPHVSCDRVYIGPYCPALRERYHAEACGGFNYIRAAEGTTDPCLTKMLQDLSQQEYLHAGMVMALLEKALKNC